MFSHVLVSYMSDMKQFAQKTAGAFETISKALEHKPRYDFCILKELTDHDNIQEDAANTNDSSFDKDQILFFAVSFKCFLIYTCLTLIFFIYYISFLQLDFEDTENANKAVDSKTSADVSKDLSLIKFYKNGSNHWAHH